MIGATCHGNDFLVINRKIVYHKFMLSRSLKSISNSKGDYK